jgi:hypothetical protein
MTQQQFISNNNNKQRLVSLLPKKLEKEAFTVKQAQEDGNTHITASAIDIGQHEEQVVIVGEDPDLLILLTAHAPSQSNIYFLKPGKGKAANLLYTTSSFKFDERQGQHFIPK